MNPPGRPLAAPSPRAARWLAAAVFAGVLAAQLALVAVAGTDVPFHDQWNIEGAWLYPAWREGTLSPMDLLRPFNEHRILWTHLLNLTLFVVDGQWDPLVQLVAIAGLRSICAAGLAWQFARQAPSRAAAASMAAAVGIAFLPHLAWHSVLWGIESHAYFALGFSLLALALLAPERRTGRATLGGCAAGVAGLLAMGPSALVPAALLGLLALRAIERRRIERAAWVAAGPAVALLALAAWLRAAVPAHAALEAPSVAQFVAAAGRVLSWPHHGGVAGAIAMNFPLLWIVAARALRRRTATPGEDFLLLVGGWSAAIGLATAWVRGGSAELAGGVPSRYVDFVVLLPLANIGCALLLAREAAIKIRAAVRVVALGWGLFVVLGWAALSAEVMRGLVLPRARDRAAPERLAREFQVTGNAAVFNGQPLLFVPHPQPAAALAVLRDPRLQGALPPTFQPERPQRPLSRAARTLLGHQ